MEPPTGVRAGWCWPLPWAPVQAQVLSHSVPECGSEQLKCPKAPAHIWDLARWWKGLWLIFKMIHMRTCALSYQIKRPPTVTCKIAIFLNKPILASLTVLGPLIWYVNAQVRMWIFLNINYNHLHYLVRSQKCAGALGHFSASESHSGTLCLASSPSTVPTLQDLHEIYLLKAKLSTHKHYEDYDPVSTQICVVIREFHLIAV